MKPLVSIITPCYNGVSFVGRFLDSILAQTYPNIEMIIINDGSTDRTEEVILSYKTKFKEKGYTLIYLFQENAGQSAAINRGLEIFKGDYMSWLDSDDAITPDFVSDKVDLFETSPEIGIAIGQVARVSDHSYSHLCTIRRYPQNNEDIVADYILDNNVVFGGYMVRTSMFRDVMPKPLKIATPRAIGQNYQLIIPIAYKHKLGIINKVDYLCTVRMNSHSRSKQSFESRKASLEVFWSVFHNLLKQCITNMDDKLRYMSMLDYVTTVKRLNLMAEYRVKEGLEDQIEFLKRSNNYKLKEHLLVLSIGSNLYRKIYSLYVRIENKYKAYVLKKNLR